MRRFHTTLALASVLSILAAEAFAAGPPITPQPVDTTGLPELGEEWLTENPWRDPDGEFWGVAVKIGGSGFNQNCARCHGIEAVSGGLAPDLRYLEADEFGDEWFLERFRHGYTQNGVTKMPPFGELLGQEAAWAIRTYFETRPDTDSLDEHVDELKGYRDRLHELATSDAAAADTVSEVEAIREKMMAIAAQVATASGAARADSIASRAAAALDGSEQGVAHAAEVLTIGLSAAE